MKMFPTMTAMLCLSASMALADATVPAKDIAGSKDSPIIKRYDGAFIVSYERMAFGDVTLPLSALEETDRKDSANNTVIVARKKLDLEGTITRLVYVLPAQRSPLEVLRNYEADAKTAGGEILYTCKGEGCGGAEDRAIGGGGGTQSLAMQLLKSGDIKDADFSNGKCALTSDISDQRFSVLRIPGGGGDAHVAVQTYQMKDDLYCKALSGRTIALVHVIEPKAREQKMVTVTASDMAKGLEQNGRIALYGLFFDTNKAEIKPESADAINEIGKLLKADPRLAVLIVGHTDNVGDYAYNTDLSRRRAEAVAGTIAKQFGVPAQRLRATGVGMAAPVASNSDDNGRSKNRRVEIVKLN